MTLLSLRTAASASPLAALVCALSAIIEDRKMPTEQQHFVARNAEMEERWPILATPGLS